MVTTRASLIFVLCALALAWRPAPSYAEGRLGVEVLRAVAGPGVTDQQAVLLSEVLGSTLSDTSVFLVTMPESTEHAEVEAALETEGRAEWEAEVVEVAAHYYLATELTRREDLVFLRGRLADAHSGIAVYAFDVSFPPEGLPSQIDALVTELNAISSLLRFGLTSENISVLVRAGRAEEAYALLRLVQQTDAVESDIVAEVYSLRAARYKAELATHQSSPDPREGVPHLSTYLALLDGTDPVTSQRMIDAAREAAVRRFRQAMSEAETLSTAGQYARAKALLAAERMRCPYEPCTESSNDVAAELKEAAVASLIRNAQAELRRGRLLLAEEYFTQGLSLAPTNEEAIAGLVLLEEARGESSEAQLAARARHHTYLRPSLEKRRLVGIGASGATFKDSGWALYGTGGLGGVRIAIQSTTPVYRPVSAFLSGSLQLFSGDARMLDDFVATRRLAMLGAGAGVGVAFGGLSIGILLGPNLGVWTVDRGAAETAETAATLGISTVAAATARLTSAVHLSVRVDRKNHWIVNGGRVHLTSVGIGIHLELADRMPHGGLHSATKEQEE